MSYNVVSCMSMLLLPFPIVARSMQYNQVTKRNKKLGNIHKGGINCTVLRLFGRMAVNRGQNQKV